MKLPRIVLAAAVAAILPLAAGAQTAGVSGQGAGNIESVPHSQPASPFNQGIGGVGNQGQVGGASAYGSGASDAARDGSSRSYHYGASPSGRGMMSERYESRHGDTANTEGNPHTRPRGEFSQGIGGVGNEGRVGGNRDTMSRGAATSPDMWRECQSMHAGAMREQCMRDYTVQYGAAGDPEGRYYNRGIGGVGGVPPQ